MEFLFVLSKFFKKINIIVIIKKYSFFISAPVVNMVKRIFIKIPGLIHTIMNFNMLLTLNQRIGNPKNLQGCFFNLEGYKHLLTSKDFFATFEVSIFRRTKKN